MSPSGPGKFEGEEASTFLLYGASMDWQPEQCGTTDGGMWHARFDGPIQAKDLVDYFQPARDYGYSDGEILFACVRLESMAGAILHEGSSGFVGADLYGVNYGDHLTPKNYVEDWATYAKEEDSGDDELHDGLSNSIVTIDDDREGGES
jgi:hypothetical protein